MKVAQVSDLRYSRIQSCATPPGRQSQRISGAPQEAGRSGQSLIGWKVAALRWQFIYPKAWPAKRAFRAISGGSRVCSLTRPWPLKSVS